MVELAASFEDRTCISGVICPVREGKVCVSQEAVKASTTSPLSLAAFTHYDALDELEKAATVTLLGDLAAAYLHYCSCTESGYHLRHGEIDAFLDCAAGCYPNQELVHSSVLWLWEHGGDGYAACRQLIEALMEVMDDGSGRLQRYLARAYQAADPAHRASLSRAVDSRLIQVMQEDRQEDNDFEWYLPDILLFIGCLGLPLHIN